MSGDIIKDIRVSFSRKEKNLRDQIEEAAEHIGKSTWMKLAAREKLERDTPRNRNQFVSSPTKNITATSSNVDNTTLNFDEFRIS